MANIFIYGSCVSRDAYGFHLQHHKLLRYIARQSWISTTSPPSSSVKMNEELASNFQKRMCQGDISSNLLPTLRETIDDIDLLLMDLVDERLGVLELENGNFITRSSELLRSKPQEILETSRHIKFGSNEALTLWKRSALSFKQHIDSLGLTNKSLIIVTPWASHNELGEIVNSTYTPKSIANVNRVLNDMSDWAEKIGFLVARMPQEYAIADSTYKWGEAPFHYCGEAIEWIAKETEQALAS